MVHRVRLQLRALRRLRPMAMRRPREMADEAEVAADAAVVDAVDKPQAGKRHLLQLCAVRWMRTKWKRREQRNTSGRIRSTSATIA